MTAWPAHPDVTHFSFLGSEDQLACPCCLCFTPTPKALDLLRIVEDLRVWWRAPIALTSMTRCPEHNVEVDGKARSSHLITLAASRSGVDLVPSLQSPQIPPRSLIPLAIERLAVRALRTPGVTGIGIYDDYLHLDNRPPKNSGRHYLWEDRTTFAQVDFLRRLRDYERNQ